jgi:dihydrolipoamide dehydrogenase
METSVEDVYAIGDILGPSKVMLAHVASHEGIIAAENAMGKNSLMNYDAIPGGIFTMPEIGTVGLSETGAKEKGFDVEAFSVNFRVLGKAQAIDEIAGEAKMIVEKSSNKILGVHIIGAHATDLVAEATLAIEKGLTAKEVAHTIHAHPTLAEIMGEVSMKASGMALHG